MEDWRKRKSNPTSGHSVHILGCFLITRAECIPDSISQSVDLNRGDTHETFHFFIFSIPHYSVLIPTGTHGASETNGGETNRGRAEGGEDGCGSRLFESRGAEAPRGEGGEGGGGVEGAAQLSCRPDEPGAGGAAC